MIEASPAMDIAERERHGHSSGILLRSIIIGLTAFLTVVDLDRKSTRLNSSH